MIYRVLGVVNTPENENAFGKIVTKFWKYIITNDREREKIIRTR